VYYRNGSLLRCLPTRVRAITLMGDTITLVSRRRMLILTALGILPAPPWQQISASLRKDHLTESSWFSLTSLPAMVSDPVTSLLCSTTTGKTPTGVSKLVQALGGQRHVADVAVGRAGAGVPTTARRWHAGRLKASARHCGSAAPPSPTTWGPLARPPPPGGGAGRGGSGQGWLHAQPPPFFRAPPAAAPGCRPRPCPDHRLSR